MDEEFKPDYRDMQTEYHYRGKSLVQSRRGRALASRNYRHRNAEKIKNYEEKHPLFRVRLPIEDLRQFERACEAAGEKPQKLVRRLIGEWTRQITVDKKTP